ncbi:MAG: hypothetical protein NUV86_07345 [Candidatus Scalindua sp.]|nr:hypothetical protein [Candidatus Scalindua sp.]MCR4344787.1 hypothetical protein [Candidatus Scalindua sp.]
MNNKQVEAFLKLQPQLKSAYAEISLLSKKKPNDQLNKFKLKFINNMLSQANELLGKKYKPFPDDFDLFDEDDMPFNSDIVFMLSNYIECLEKLRCDNIKSTNYKWYWVIDGKISDHKTDHPTIK